ncbi:MAG: hypothetical protein IJE16_08800 [Ruminococcus sp.]|nr:hypothetical protein [Ruminococcus sp.]
MSIFDRNKRPRLKSESYYEDESENRVKQYLKFPVFVGAALVLVVLIIVFMFIVNHNNNAFAMLNKASVKAFDCGSFHYRVDAGMNGTSYMQYEGDMEFDLNTRIMNSSYHAVYENYEYDAVVYGQGATAYRGNFYKGKWSVDDYSEKMLDFFDFYRDYRKGDFDAGAAVRFTDSNDVFNAQQLGEAMNDIFSQLSKSYNMNTVMGQEIKVENGETTVTFKPQMKEVFDLVVSEIGSAFSGADAYAAFKESVENSEENLFTAQLTMSYTINKEGYLTDLSLIYTVNHNTYFVVAELSEFSNTQVVIPQDFLVAANIG